MCTTKVVYWGFSEGNEGYRSKCESVIKMGLAYRKLIGKHLHTYSDILHFPPKTSNDLAKVMLHYWHYSFFVVSKKECIFAS